MPKEFIHCRDFGRSYPVVLDGAEQDRQVEMTSPDNDAVKVAWSKESEHVELAVCQMVDGTFVEHGFLSEIGEPEGENDPKVVLRLAQLTPRYIQMDRHGINRLIRILRKARDDAYGRDE